MKDPNLQKIMQIVTQKEVGKINDLLREQWEKGVRQADFYQAFDWVLKEADKGDPDAWDLLDEVCPYLKKNTGGLDFKGIKVHEGIAEEDAEVRAKLDYLYKDSICNFDEDYDSWPLQQVAARWFLKFAEQGEVIAQTYVGMLYRYGKGVLQNKEEATKWFRLAAEQGDIEAKFELADMNNEVQQESRISEGNILIMNTPLGRLGFRCCVDGIPLDPSLVKFDLQSRKTIPHYPEGQGVQGSRAVLLAIENQQELSNFTFECSWIDTFYISSGSDSGEFLEAHSFIGNTHQVTVGTTDFRGLSNDLGEAVRLQNDAFYPIIFTENGLTIHIAKILPENQIKLHFNVAWNLYPEPYSSTCSFAVDTTPDIIT